MFALRAADAVFLWLSCASSLRSSPARAALALTSVPLAGAALVLAACAPFSRCAATWLGVLAAALSLLIAAQSVLRARAHVGTLKSAESTALELVDASLFVPRTIARWNSDLLRLTTWWPGSEAPGAKARRRAGGSGISTLPVVAWQSPAGRGNCLFVGPIPSPSTLRLLARDCHRASPAAPAGLAVVSACEWYRGMAPAEPPAPRAEPAAGGRGRQPGGCADGGGERCGELAEDAAGCSSDLLSQLGVVALALPPFNGARQGGYACVTAALEALRLRLLRGSFQNVLLVSDDDGALAVALACAFVLSAPASDATADSSAPAVQQPSAAAPLGAAVRAFAARLRAPSSQAPLLSGQAAGARWAEAAPVAVDLRLCERVASMAADAGLLAPFAKAAGKQPRQSQRQPPVPGHESAGTGRKQAAAERAHGPLPAPRSPAAAVEGDAAEDAEGAAVGERTAAAHGEAVTSWAAKVGAPPAAVAHASARAPVCSAAAAPAEPAAAARAAHAAPVMVLGSAAERSGRGAGGGGADEDDWVSVRAPARSVRAAHGPVSAACADGGMGSAWGGAGGAEDGLSKKQRENRRKAERARAERERLRLVAQSADSRPRGPVL